MRWFHWVLAVFGLLVVVVAALAVNVLYCKPVTIGLFYSRTMLVQIWDEPEILTQLRLLEPLGISGHNARWSDASDEADLKRFAKARSELAVLRSYDRSKQSEEQLVSTDVLDWFLDNTAAAEPFRFHNYPVSQIFGVQAGMVELLTEAQQVHSRADARNYIHRLSTFRVKIGQVLTGLHTREAKGIIPPDFVIQRTLDQMKAFLAPAPQQNTLYTSFAEKMQKEPGLTAAERQAFLNQAEAAIGDSVYGAHRDLIAYYEHLLPKATHDAGIWHLPGGDAAYAYYLRANTTTNLTPDQVHTLGLREVARISDEMQPLLEQLGYGKRPLSQALRDFSKDPKFLWPDTPETPAKMLAEYNEIIAEAQRNLSVMFRMVPKAKVIVERYPAYSELASASGQYLAAPMDNSKPGVFMVRLDAGVRWRPGMKTLTYHEAVPGHHYQIALQQEQTALPMFRRVLPFNAYAEGWALYAERVAAEAGFYKGDPAGDLARLNDEMLRAVRLVVDTGMHAKHWSREQAIDYMRANLASSDAEIVAEIERYAVAPGQACGYKAGQLKILELRERARQRLGAKFDIRDFHDVVLGGGAMPLEILERCVEKYIERKSQS